jgi:hypothetical protein
MVKLNKIAAISLMAVGMTFVGCMEQTSSPTPASQDTPSVVMSVKVGMDPVNTLAKASLISLKKLILVLASNTNDTIRDTITTTTTPAISATSTSPQTVNVNFTLKPLRTWKVIATTKDLNDTVIHVDTVVTPVLNDGDTAHVAMTLSSRFSMYQAQFMIPDSISSSVVGTVKQVVNINRLVLMIDGVVKKDSTVSPGPFYAPKVNAVLGYDYVPVGNHTVQLLAYGPMYSWPIGSALYTSAVTPINNVLVGNDSTTAITLAWTGPTTGTGAIAATIGKVGKVTINGTLPGSVVP